MLTSRNVPVAMTERPDFRALWVAPEFDPIGHVAMVDHDGLQTGHFSLYDTQEWGINGSFRVAEFNGVDIKGCGKTVKDYTVADGYAEGGQAIHFNTGLVNLREAMSELMGGQIIELAGGNHRSYGVVQVELNPSSNGYFKQQGQKVMTPLLLRKPVDRLYSLLNDTYPKETIMADLRNGNPDIVEPDDRLFILEFMKKFARNQAWLWARRIMLPDVSAGNISISGEFYDNPILGFMSDYRELYGNAGRTNYEAVLKTLSEINAVLYKLVFTGVMEFEDYIKDFPTPPEVYHEARKEACADIMGHRDPALRTALLANPKFANAAELLVDYIQDDSDKCTHKIFNGAHFFTTEFYTGKAGGDVVALHEALVNGTTLEGHEALVTAWSEILAEYQESELVHIIADWRLLDVDLSQKWISVLSPNVRGWTHHRQDLPLDVTPAVWGAKFDEFLQEVKTNLY